MRGAHAEIQRRLDGTHWLRFRGRYLPLQPCPAGAIGVANSFRPTACRTRRSKTKTSNPDPNQIHPASRSSLEEALEADISTWHKTGHFYFALTVNVRLGST